MDAPARHVSDPPRRERSPRRASGALTKSMVARLRPGAILWDGKISELFAVRLRDDREGRPRVAYKIMVNLPRAVQRARLDGARKLTRRIGTSDDTSAAVARERARAAVADIRKGGDVDRPVSAAGPPLRAAYDAYAADLRKLGRSAATFRAYDFSAARWPAGWMLQPIGAVAANRAAVRALHDKLTADSGPVAANQSIKLLRTVVDHAAAIHPGVPTLPKNLVAFHRVGSRAHTALGLDQIAGWWRRVREHVPSETGRLFLLFEVLTGLRKNDVATALRRDLDVRRRTLLVPRPKGGPERSFVLYLSRAAVNVAKRSMALRDPDAPGGERVFCGERGGEIDVARVCRENGIAHNHSLRHSWATVAEGLGVDEAQRGRIMNHAAATETGRYGSRDKNYRLWLSLADKIGDAVMKRVGRLR